MIYKCQPRYLQGQNESMSEPEYFVTVEHLEESLLKCAKRSFESFSNEFVDGGNIFSYYSQQWEKNNFKLRNRTPIQLERDRILYSPGMRKQTEKYHVLYNGQRRIVRAYATHAMKMAQVSRAIARGLQLNQDFAEAIALGAKVGAVPFIHAAKTKMTEWAESQLKRIDAELAPKNPRDNTSEQQLDLDFAGADIPDVVSGLKSSVVLDKVQRFMPWAAGQRNGSLYSSGQESYWLLCTNPFTSEARKDAYFPETMYGVWRHTRGSHPGAKQFKHIVKLAGARRGHNLITDDHATFEALIVQYADDITWVIENLNDANEVALLNGKVRSIYEELAVEVDDIDPAFDDAIKKNDAGGLYTYFIGAFVRYSSGILAKGGGELAMREALRKGDKAVRIGLSPEADQILAKLVSFLHSRIFTEPRTKNRSEMLRSISGACIELIYHSADVLSQAIQDQSRLHRWTNDVKNNAIKMLDDPVHRVQLSLDILSSWGDQEIYDFVGIQSL
jgi:dGTP triphosphohydrolase